MWQKKTRTSVSGVGTFTDLQRYTLRSVDGTQIALDDTFQPINQDAMTKKLSITIEGELYRRLVSKATAAYDAGIPVTFGKLTVSQQGLSHGKKTLAWEQVEDINDDEDRMTISKKGQRSAWFAVPRSKMPNALVLLSLAEYALKSQHEQLSD